jgi:hypothetical protein
LCNHDQRRRFPTFTRVPSLALLFALSASAGDAALGGYTITFTDSSVNELAGTGSIHFKNYNSIGGPGTFSGTMTAKDVTEIPLGARAKVMPERFSLTLAMAGLARCAIAYHTTTFEET